MIAHIQGRLVEKSPTAVVIDCNGWGYDINISLHTFGLLPNEGSVKLFTHLQIKEDAHMLFGFAERGERDIFRLLITVSGIGPGIARTMLSSIEPALTIRALANGDVATIQRMKGIGAKTAQRAILDLRDKVLKLNADDYILSGHSNTNRDEALS